MPVDMILPNNANIKIKDVKQTKKIIIECEDKIEYYCPKCGSYHLRCKDCGCYFNSTPQGFIKTPTNNGKFEARGISQAL